MTLDPPSLPPVAADAAATCREGEDAPLPGGLEPKVVEVYQGVGKVMSRYTAGKVRAGRRAGLRRTHMRCWQRWVHPARARC